MCVCVCVCFWCFIDFILQATAEVKQLKSQVAQEQNLRSIAESVLVDERAMKQTLVENYSKACTLCKQAMELVHSR